jgi:hypothetical protein
MRYLSKNRCNRKRKISKNKRSYRKRSRSDGVKKKSKGPSIKKTLLAGALTGLLLGITKKYGGKVDINTLNNYVNNLNIEEIQDFIADIPYKFTTEDITPFQKPENMFTGLNYEPKDLRIKVVDEIFEDILPHGVKVNTNIKPQISDILKYTAEGNIPQLQYSIQKLNKYVKNYRDSEGNTLIMDVINNVGSTSGDFSNISKENMYKSIILLGENLVDVNAKNNDGYTALHIATYRYMPEAIDILLSLGADPLIKNNRGQTPIHVAITRGKPALINHLIKRKAGINSKDLSGKTILEKLVEIGSQDDSDFSFDSVMDTLKYLIKNDAHITLKNFNRIINNPEIYNEYKNLLKRYKKRIVKG